MEDKDLEFTNATVSADTKCAWGGKNKGQTQNYFVVANIWSQRSSKSPDPQTKLKQTLGETFYIISKMS